MGGCVSLILLEKIGDILFADGYAIGNIDATVVAQKPRLAEFIPDMENRIADVLRIEKSQINVKATTEEGLGFTGNEQGISAMAVALLISTR